MMDRKLRGNGMGKLYDNLEKQDVINRLWALVDKPYYCDPVRRKFDSSSVYRAID